MTDADRDAWATLVAYASRIVDHEDTGDCPDVDATGDRSESCAVCRALVTLGYVEPATGTERASS